MGDLFTTQFSWIVELLYFKESNLKKKAQTTDYDKSNQLLCYKDKSLKVISNHKLSFYHKANCGRLAINELDLFLMRQTGKGLGRLYLDKTTKQA